MESNSVTHGVQDLLFILRVLFGLVMTQLSQCWPWSDIVTETCW
jgi:hypothetical protein